jgi:membrane associated rhomboid family serine protease
MKQRPYGTLSLILLTIIVTAASALFDGSLYGVEAHPADWWSFSPTAPMRLWRLTWLLSAFLHLGPSHLVTNLFILFPVAMMIERKKGPAHLLGMSALIHLLVLGGLLFGISLWSLQGKAFLGSSHFILGLYMYWGILQRRWSLLLLPAGVLLWGVWQDQSSLILLAHILGTLAGVGLGVGSHFREKLRLQRPN